SFASTFAPNMRELPCASLFHAFSLVILSAGLASSGRAQSNIVFNGGFEQIGGGWTFSSLGISSSSGAAEGNIFITVFDHLYQDLPTIPGRDYVLTFASVQLQRDIQWADTSVTNLTNFAASGFLWKYFYAYVHADSNVSRLRFNGGGALDDVKVRWGGDPIVIVAQPESRSAFEGASVSFSVTPDGVPPLQYQ